MDQQFCQRCGARLVTGAAFCSGCGAKTEASSAGAPQMPPPPMAPHTSYHAGVQARGQRGALIACVIALCAVVIGAAAYFLMPQDMRARLGIGGTAAKPAATETKSTAQGGASLVPREAPPPAAKEKTGLERMQEILTSKGYKGSVLATTAPSDPRGGISLSFVVWDSARWIVVYDPAEDRTAYVVYDPARFAYLTQRAGASNVAFVLNVINAPREADAQAGIWEGSEHRVPIMAEYTASGEAIEPGMLTTAYGVLATSFFPNYLYEQRHVDYANAVLVQMPALLRAARERNVNVN